MQVTVKYQPTEWTLGFDGFFECQHASTTSDTIEHYNHYMEAVTGVPQALSYELIENCDDCPAYYSSWTEEWYDGGSNE